MELLRKRYFITQGACVSRRSGDGPGPGLLPDELFSSLSKRSIDSAWRRCYTPFAGLLMLGSPPRLCILLLSLRIPSG